jgi:hypothetical protein
MTTGAGWLASPASGEVRALRKAKVRLLAESPRWRIIAAWGISRLLVFAAAAVVQMSGVPRPSWKPSFLGHPFALLEVWDGRWYTIVAEHGYLLVPDRPSDPAFFPLLPLLLHAGHELGLPYGFVGVALMNLALLGALIALYELGRVWLDEPAARRAAIYAALMPAGFVFSMIYPEALSLGLLALGGLFAVKRSWFPCAVCAALVTLARPEGVLLALPIAVCAVRSWQALTPAARGRAIGAVLAGPAVLISLLVYFWWVVGDPFAWMKAQHAWGRAFALPGIYRAAAELATSFQHGKGWLLKDAVFCLLYLVALLFALRAHIPVSWILAGAAMILLPLASGSFTSDARFGLLALPVYWGLGAAAHRPRIDLALRVGFALLLVGGVFTILLRFP